MRMTERSTRGTTGLSTRVRPLKPWTLLCTICEEGWGWRGGVVGPDRRMRLRGAVGAGGQCCTPPGGSLTSNCSRQSHRKLSWRETGFLILGSLCSLPFSFHVY